MNQITRLKQAGYRELASGEIDRVAGGNGGVLFTVTGQRYSDIAAFLTAHGDGAAGLAGGNPFASLGSFTGLDLEGLADYLEDFLNDQPEITEEELEELTKKALDLLGAGLEDLVKKYGDFDITIGESGPTFKASNLVDGFKFLGAADIVVTGISLGTDAYNDNLNVAEALGFVAGLAALAGLTAAGAPALGVAIGVLLAQEGVEAIVDGTAQELVDTLLAPIVESAIETLPPLPNILPPADPYLTPSEQEAEYWRNFFNPYGAPVFPY